MTPTIHKTSWREREQPYVRPRVSQDDIDRARSDAEWEEAREQAAKWICIVLVCVLIALVAGVAL
jgi:hypothetical protein